MREPRSAAVQIEHAARTEAGCRAAGITDPLLVRMVADLVRAQDELLTRVCAGQMATESETRRYTEDRQ